MRTFLDFITSAVLLIFVRGGLQIGAQPLDCFKCFEIANIDNCHSTATCRQGEHCYTETYLNKTGNLVFTLGCREQEFCRGLDQAFGKKRMAASPGCLQCCTLHGCNKYLCPLRYQTPSKPVNGAWSSWGPWSMCDNSCGIGLKARYRACNNPTPSKNGKLCLGDAKDVKICQTSCTTVPVVKTTKATPTLKLTTPTTTTSTTTSTTTTTTTPIPPIQTTQPPTQTTQPPTQPPATKNTTHPPYVTHDLTQKPGDCKDLIECSGYYRPDACKGIYSAWAHRYCPMHCGFCPNVTPEPCVNTISNCQEYQDDLCTNAEFWQWRESNCRKYCKLC